MEVSASDSLLLQDRGQGALQVHQWNRILAAAARCGSVAEWKPCEGEETETPNP